jgi:hypothetical protein
VYTEGEFEQYLALMYHMPKPRHRLRTELALGRADSEATSSQ